MFTPEIYDPYIPVKYNILILLSGLLCFFLSLRKENRFFRVSPLQVICLLLCLGVYIFHALSSKSIFNESSLINYLSIFAIACALSIEMRRDNLTLKKVAIISLVPFILVSTIGLVQYANIPTSFLPKGQGAISTLANINMVAQYLGLTSPLILYLYFNTESRTIRRIIEVSLALAVTYLIYCMCRSIMLGCLGALVIATVGRYFPLGFYLRTLVLIAMFFSLVSYTGVRSGGSLEDIRPVTSFETKTKTTSGRLVIWANTLDMISDSIIGHGPGSFEYKFHKYNLDEKNRFSNEKTVFLSPHNEFLRLSAEEGFIFLLTIILLIGLLFFRALSSRKNQSQYRNEIRLCLLYLPIFGAECLFQFPFILPVGILYGGILLGVLLYLSKSDSPDFIHLPFKRVLLFLAFILLTTHSIRKWNADYVFSSLKRDLEASRIACRLYPNHWRVCNQQAFLEATHGNFLLARELSDGMLQKNEYFFPSIHVRFNIEHIARDFSASCHYAKKYDSLFFDSSSLHHYVQRKCVDIASHNDSKRMRQ